MHCSSVVSKFVLQPAVEPFLSGSQTRSIAPVTLQFSFPGGPAGTETFTAKVIKLLGSPTGTYGGWLAGPLTESGVLMSLKVQAGGHGIVFPGHPEPSGPGPHSAGVGGH